jgi:hypothetical protein
MARFRYLGEHMKPGALTRLAPGSVGPTLAFIFHEQDGSKPRLDAPDPIKGFQIGDDLGVDLSDARVLRHLRSDPRFEEIL